MTKSVRVAFVGPVVKEYYSELSGVEFFPNLDSFSEQASVFEVVVYRGEDKLDENFFKISKRLKLLVKPAVGLDNVDLKAASARGVQVKNVPDGATISVAEYVIGALISFLRKLPAANASAKSGKWDRASFHGAELYGKTVGILGLGRIGRAVASRFKAFGVNLVAYDPYLPLECFDGVKRVNSIPELLSTSDIISIHVPLESSTKNLFNEESVAHVKKGAILINTSRGDVVDEIALIGALKSGVLSGAILDVRAKEPPEKNELLTLKNVMLTPHLAASTNDAQKRIASEVIKIIREF